MRNLGFRALVPRLGAVGERTWLLSTDADTVVPPTWVVDHLRHAAAGADAVAGAVDLDDPHLLPADALARYTALVAARIAGRTHGHAYAANLGVRAGVPARRRLPGRSARSTPCSCGCVAGHVVSPTDVRARTSARRDGRARGGLADLLRALT